MMTDEPQRQTRIACWSRRPPPCAESWKIFFGACAGVGKTWAMLAEAQRLRAQGLDIVAGVVETHGRKETAEMLKGLTVLPQKRLVMAGALSA